MIFWMRFSDDTELRFPGITEDNTFRTGNAGSPEDATRSTT
jgi:hypothetical protein